MQDYKANLTLPGRARSVHYKSPVYYVLLVLIAAILFSRLMLSTKAQKQQVAQTADSQQNKESDVYRKLLPELSAAQKKNFEQEMASLKLIAEKFQPAITAAQKKLGFDPEAMNAELLAITKDTDRARRMQRQKAFEAKYEPQVIKLTQAAGIDVAAQRRQMISLLDLKNTPVDDGRTLGIVIGDDQRQVPMPAVTPMPRPEVTPTPGPESTPTPTPPEPDVIERSYTAPYSYTSTGGAEVERRATSSANASTGDMIIDVSALGAMSLYKEASISQTIPVERGIHRIHVSVTLDPFMYAIGGAGVGYGSSEAVVALRITEGSRAERIFCSDRESLGRIIWAVVGYGVTQQWRPITLQCEFTQPVSETTNYYSLVAEIEGWAGAGGFAAASSTQAAHIRQFQVSLDRR